MDTPNCGISPRDRVCLCGFTREGEEAVFVLERDRFPSLLRSSVKAYLAADFNGWQKARGVSEWQLHLKEDGLLELRKPWVDMESHAPFSFKFINGNGRWLDPPDEAPNIDIALHGARNFIFALEFLGFAFSQKTHDLDEIAASHVPAGWFGVRVEAGDTRFRFFAPRATSVTLCVSSQTGMSDFQVHHLAQDRAGTWEVAVLGNLSGQFYHYLVDGDDEVSPGTTFIPDRPVLDPYALAALGPAGPGIIVKWPLPVAEPFAPPKREDLVIVETHLRDLLAHAPAVLTSRERLTFSGLAKWVRSKDCYLRKLGVNAIELQPVLEPDAKTSEEYFWGYMPVSFFAPASHYSSRPEVASGIAEFRDVVASFHEAGISVILDVVYNHVGLPNHLAPIDKGLYFSTDRLGRLTNHSGCGNDLRASSPAVRRLVIDSLKYLVQTFDLDGFRLDLADLLGLDFLREIESELLPLKPSLHLIAEPWSFRGRLPAEVRDTTYSLWSDDLREGLLAYAKGKGDSASVLRWLQGHSLEKTSRPAQIVNYLESHDDYAFLDRLTENPRRNGFNPTPLDLRRHRLALAVLFASPGVPMLSAGQDFLRSKKGVCNTYLRGDLNALDYSLIEKYPEHHAYVRDWITLRLSSIGKLFRPVCHPSQAYYQAFESEDGQAAALLINADSSAGPERLLFAINPSVENTARIPVTPEQFGSPLLLANHEEVSRKGLTDNYKREEDCLLLPPLNTACWKFLEA